MSQVEIKNADEIAIMRDAGRIVSEILDELARAVEPGVSTWELERLAEDLIYKKGAKPAFKGYGPSHSPFPCCLCASVNEEVVHGIPSKKRKLVEGDLMKLDFGVQFRGYFGDSARTIPVGKVSAEAERLLTVTRESLFKGIEAAVSGNRIGDVGHAIQVHAEAAGFSVVRDFVGHGIGKKLHEAPQVPNFGAPGTGMRLRPGIVLALEPMVNAGTHKVRVLSDAWTAVTDDRKLSAHFEHTIVVRDGPPEILTKPA